MILLEPQEELVFQRPFQPVMKQIVCIKNDDPSLAVAFKVKTTAPKNYCVRPNSGKIAPNSSIEVQILLQAMKEETLPADFKCKDKFLIQSIRIPNDLLVQDGEEASSRLQELWTQAEQLKKVDPSIVCERKIRCVFQPAPIKSGGDDKENVASNNSTTTPSSPPTTVSPVASNTQAAPVNSAAEKPAAAPVKPAAAPVSPALVSSKETTADSSTQPSLDSSQNHPSSVPASHVSSQTSPAPSTSLDLEKELKEAKESVKRLTAACEGYRAEIDRLNALRQRKTAADPVSVSPFAKDSNGTALATLSSGGVPLQVTALIAFISLIIGILFF